MAWPRFLDPLLDRVRRPVVLGDGQISVRVDGPWATCTVHRFSWIVAQQGLAIGTDRNCHIRLRGSGVRAVHARLQPASNHWVLKSLPRGQKLPLPAELEGQFDRVDRMPFVIEGYRLQISD
jgi:hypothetical protein